MSQVGAVDEEDVCVSAIDAFEAAVGALSSLVPECVTVPLLRGLVEVERRMQRLWIVHIDCLKSGKLAEKLDALPRRATRRYLLVGELCADDLALARKQGLLQPLRADVRATEMAAAVEQAFDLLTAQANSERHGERLSRFEYELDELIDIARALSKERDTSKLLGLILERSRFVTAADAGSLYVIERGAGSEPTVPESRKLEFRLSQNDSIAFDSQQFQVPVSRSSMAGWVVLERAPIRIDDVYNLPVDSPYGFDRSFDNKTGYRTKSMLCAPLISSRGEVIGVLQLINKKRSSSHRLLTEADALEEVVPFDDRSERLLVTLAAQAGIALENALLYDEIRGLFEGFVRASVEAIEARDPTTSGHSRRVAEYTLRLADAVDRCDTGPYRGVHFNAESRRELEYAALLHDFGKIGVREHVLVKAKKLYPHELQSIHLRIELLLSELEVTRYREHLEFTERGASIDEIRHLLGSVDQRRLELQQAFATIDQAAEPTVLRSQDRELIDRIERMTLLRQDGTAESLLSASEIACLRIERGSLTAEEFTEIRSHVSHTHRFLSQIPWGKALRNVPKIAGAHHERLNGTGYPHGLTAEQIPLESKIMSVTDIFDALTASDRPYKRAVPYQRALDILDMEARDGHLDPELVRIFRSENIELG